jgi:hypothetical protein
MANERGGMDNISVVIGQLLPSTAVCEADLVEQHREQQAH